MSTDLILHRELSNRALELMNIFQNEIEGRKDEINNCIVKLNVTRHSANDNFLKLLLNLTEERERRSKMGLRCTSDFIYNDYKAI